MFMLYRHSRRGVFALLLFSAGAFFGDSVWIQAKAKFAQYLIADAWHKTLETGDKIKPWAWADTWPVARLQSAVNNIDLYVLEGAKGNSLAFGPGYMQGSADLNSHGTAVIAGHKDTHFKFMSKMQLNDELQLTDFSGVTQRYQVHDLHVVDSRVEHINLEGDKQTLLLVTCYPFDTAEVGGPLRYVAKAKMI
ncbi:MAG: sortase A [Pseudohongiellaceae bacterium]|jgi:sortase A